MESIRVGLSRIKLSDISYDGKTKHPHFLSPMDIESILTYLDGMGYVQLDENQEMPEIQHGDYENIRVDDAFEGGQEYAQFDMKRKGFKRIKSSQER